MRWTIWKTAHGSGVAGPVISPSGETVQVVPASFTDEDVERVAEALAKSCNLQARHDRPYWEDKARRALSAYLEPTTKKET